MSSNKSAYAENTNDQAIKVSRQGSPELSNREDIIQSQSTSRLVESLKASNKARTKHAAEGNKEDAMAAETEYVRVHKELGMASHADYRIDDIRCPINVYEVQRCDGIKPNPRFEEKGLCTHSVGIGLSCGHECAYCSSPAMMRTHRAFSLLEMSSFTPGIALVDPNSAERMPLPTGGSRYRRYIKQDVR